MAHSAGHDLTGSIGLIRGAIPSTSATAAGSGDSTSVTGASVDLTSLGARFHSAGLALNTQSTLTSGQSIAVKASVQTSVNDSDWTVHTAVATIYTHTATGAAATGIHRGGMVNVDLSKVGRYVRAIVTPDLSHAGTDTAVVTANWVFGNPDRIPIVA